MSNAHNPIRLFETVVDECPYIEGNKSASILVDPDHQVDNALFTMLSRSGFRRSGDMLYSPKCPDCNACVSVRIPVARFVPSRGQKRVWRKNTDLTVTIEDVTFQQEHFDLYLKYQQHRHPDSSMCDGDPDKYIGFIDSYFSRSKFLCFRLNEELVGISVLDQFDGGLSAVYTFFDPELNQRSIGTYAILYMIKLCRLRDIPFVYLGYWIEDSEKMNYKRKFKPLQGHIDRQWKDLSL
ncbi:arginyltransferase [Arenicella xantha]|uniref:Aspartate/glutamate leucyltransferase n=1 Tax=Arenicella xantha TaxID=644221 RepID=A0A395JGH9_9GAMM|nr:arginyltransferase [Arenicella xantha]RBP48481.1 arginine-tRNA-protein transferase [Arenicella xantha]